jgi:hypothetical protein
MSNKYLSTAMLLNGGDILLLDRAVGRSENLGMPVLMWWA